MADPALPPDGAEARIARVIRTDRGRILAALVRHIGDFALAEDCLQDAVVSALDRWARDGLPKAPDAWLITVARRKALDRLRRDANFARKAPDIAHLLELEAISTPDEPMGTIPDHRLELIFTCCHPAIGRKSRVALTLRALGGLSTGEIAAAFLDKPEAMAARLTRAKRKISDAGIAYRVPGPDELPARLAGVLRVIYLIFNEGYRASASDRLIRPDLIEEAMRLARILHRLMPDEAEVSGLLALLLLHDSRRTARTDADGALVPLERQDRALWDRERITEGTGLLDLALTQGQAGHYAIQAAISALHANTANFAATDWNQIAALYEALHALEPNPVIRVNQAVAMSYAGRPGAALKMLDAVGSGGAMDRYQPYFTARADILARLDLADDAVRAVTRALELTTAPEERAFLTARLANLRGP